MVRDDVLELVVAEIDRERRRREGWGGRCPRLAGRCPTAPALEHDGPAERVRRGEALRCAGVHDPGLREDRGADGQPGGSGLDADLERTGELVAGNDPDPAGDAIQLRLAQAAGLRFQLDEVDYMPDTWVNADATVAEVAARVDEAVDAWLAANP